MKLEATKSELKYHQKLDIHWSESQKQNSNGKIMFFLFCVSSKITCQLVSHNKIYADILMQCICKLVLSFSATVLKKKSQNVSWSFWWKEQHPPCEGAPEPGLFPQYKSAPPPQESDPVGTNEWTSPRRSHSLYSHTQTDTQAAWIDIIEKLQTHTPCVQNSNKQTYSNRHKHKKSIYSAS